MAPPSSGQRCGGQQPNKVGHFRTGSWERALCCGALKTMLATIGASLGLTCPCQTPGEVDGESAVAFTVAVGCAHCGHGLQNASGATLSLKCKMGTLHCDSGSSEQTQGAYHVAS